LLRAAVLKEKVSKITRNKELVGLVLILGMTGWIVER